MVGKGKYNFSFKLDNYEDWTNIYGVKKEIFKNVRHLKIVVENMLSNL